MLKHGILGLLNYGDMSGYKIREVFKNSLNYFWTAQTSQIYRELGVLEKSGWIEKRTVEQEGKPNKNICSITEEGRKELLRWLLEPRVDMDMDMDMRSPVLMKTFFMGELPVTNSLHFFKELNKAYCTVLNDLQQTDNFINAYQETISDKKRSLFWQMTSDFGKRYMQMHLDWTERCIYLLESMEE
nr:PadR family transcriptional regulator [uncultured Agathobaculum sp.]